MADPDTPALPLTTYVRSRLLTMLRGADVPQAAIAPPDFRGCPLRGQIACLTNLLLIERGLVDASRAADRPWWNELDAAHKKESEWLGAFQIHERVRGA